MQPRPFSRYLVNCFWLMLPPLAISGLLAGSLPAVFQPELFWLDIPALVAWPENVSRVLITGLPLLMPLAVATPGQRRGAAIYGVGVIAYGLAFWPLIAAPDSGWSTSLAGFAAPAITPLLWLVGIGLVGSGSARWLRISYTASAALFLVCHNLHTLLVYSRHLPG